MVALAILGVLASIAVGRYADLILKSRAGANRGNMASLRSSLNIYYSDNEQSYPRDSLNSLAAGAKYLEKIPELNLVPIHAATFGVTAEVSPSDVGQWSYNNTDSDSDWGKLAVGCLHNDPRGTVWSSN